MDLSGDFYRSLNDGKLFFFQVSWTLQSILSDFNNVLVWMVSILPLISCFLSI